MIPSEHRHWSELRSLYIQSDRWNLSKCEESECEVQFPVWGARFRVKSILLFPRLYTTLLESWSVLRRPDALRQVRFSMSVGKKSCGASPEPLSRILTDKAIVTDTKQTSMNRSLLSSVLLLFPGSSSLSRMSVTFSSRTLRRWTEVSDRDLTSALGPVVDSPTMIAQALRQRLHF